MKTVLIVLLIVLEATCYEEKQGTIRVALFRQKSPRDQYLTFSQRYWQEKVTDGLIPLYRYADNEFYGKIVVGKPGQSMNVAFDTAWSLTWVLSSKCSTLTTPGCMFHNLYDHDKSSSYKKDGSPFVSDIGTFNLTGFYSYDTISVFQGLWNGNTRKQGTYIKGNQDLTFLQSDENQDKYISVPYHQYTKGFEKIFRELGMKVGSSNVTAFSFVEMASVPNSFFINKADGALGLGTQYGDYEPFFYALYRQKKVRAPIFSIYLNSNRKAQNAGSLMLGFVDKQFVHKTKYPNGTVIPDSVKYLRVDEGVNWKFSVDSIVITPNQTIPKKNITLCGKGCKAISDTSSNEISGPVDDVNKILALINAKKFFGRWTVDCSILNKLPRVDFVLGGQKFSLDGPQYVTKTSVMFIKVCVPAFVPTTYSSDGGLWILGGAFLSQYYSIYNIADKTIGFVKAV